jgi:hypothetical protein
MNRKPIFDAVRTLLSRSFTQNEVDALDLACDLAEAGGQPSLSAATKLGPAKVNDSPTHKLGSLSKKYESGKNGPETVSTGVGDPGGVSYGLYQLSSKKGTCAAFVRVEGKLWAIDFGDKKPGTAEFTMAWKAVAARDAVKFGEAQHSFIERTHYRPVVASVDDAKGFNLDQRSNAIRDATWSCAVQHKGAPSILIDAIDKVDRDTARDASDYDRKLIEAIYEVRIAYVLKAAQNPKLSMNERNQLVSITQNRYPSERTDALAMLGNQKPVSSVTPSFAGQEVVDGNLVAAANGVGVKSAAVKISKLHPKMEAVIVAVSGAARKLGLPKPVITSGNDSGHSKGSLHYQNKALDFRGNNIKTSVGQILGDEVSARLGGSYDVLFEVFVNPANNHLHVEYDPN